MLSCFSFVRVACAFLCSSSLLNAFMGARCLYNRECLWPCNLFGTLVHLVADRVILFLTDGIPQDSRSTILTEMESQAAFFQYRINVLTYALGNGTLLVEYRLSW